MLLWNFVKINHLQDLKAKQNHFLRVKAQGKVSVNDPGANKKVSDPYINSWIVLAPFTSNTYWSIFITGRYYMRIKEHLWHRFNHSRNHYCQHYRWGLLVKRKKTQPFWFYPYINVMVLFCSTRVVDMRKITNLLTPRLCIPCSWIRRA